MRPQHVMGALLLVAISYLNGNALFADIGSLYAACQAPCLAPPLPWNHPLAMAAAQKVTSARSQSRGWITHSCKTLYAMARLPLHSSPFAASPLAHEATSPTLEPPDLNSRAWRSATGPRGCCCACCMCAGLRASGGACHTGADSSPLAQPLAFFHETPLRRWLPQLRCAPRGYDCIPFANVLLCCSCC
jgi:hypothetical protein